MDDNGRERRPVKQTGDEVFSLRAEVDGGSRGNPGPAASAYILTDVSGRVVEGKGKFIGKATNNVAEYKALTEALAAALKLGAGRIEIVTDSELLAKQLTGEYRVKSSTIRPYFQKATELLERFERPQIRHVRREKNKRADSLVNRSLDLEKDVALGGEGEASSLRSFSGRKRLRVGFLISGGGRTMMNILEEIRSGRLNAEISVVISSRSTVVEKAEKAGLPVKIVRKKDFPDIDSFSAEIEKHLAAAEVELVVQGGWLCLWRIPERYINRVMNIHPALLPSFGGKGMWGSRVHEAVLKAGCKVSGCTVHFCTNEYDKGPIIIQKCCEVKDDDTCESLAARVFKEECTAYPEAIKLFEQGRLMVENNRVKTKPHLNQ